MMNERDEAAHRFDELFFNLKRFDFFEDKEDSADDFRCVDFIIGFSHLILEFGGENLCDDDDFYLFIDNFEHDGVPFSTSCSINGIEDAFSLLDISEKMVFLSVLLRLRNLSKISS